MVHCTASRLAPGLDSVITALEVLPVGLDIAASDSQFAGAPISRGADIGRRSPGFRRVGSSLDEDCPRGALARAAEACRGEGDLRGARAVILTYEPDGQISEVHVEPPFTEPAVSACVERWMHTAKADPYDGRSFSWGEAASDGGAVVPDAGAGPDGDPGR